LLTDSVRAVVEASAQSSARQLLDITVCPYDPGGPAQERELARVWVAAYLAVRPPALDAIDYTIGGG
jgi:hypothetical protein